MLRTAVGRCGGALGACVWHFVDFVDSTVWNGVRWVTLGDFGVTLLSAAALNAPVRGSVCGEAASPAGSEGGKIPLRGNNLLSELSQSLLRLCGQWVESGAGAGESRQGSALPLSSSSSSSILGRPSVAWPAGLLSLIHI